MTIWDGLRPEICQKSKLKSIKNYGKNSEIHENSVVY